MRFVKGFFKFLGYFMLMMVIINFIQTDGYEKSKTEITQGE